MPARDADPRRLLGAWWIAAILVGCSGVVLFGLAALKLLLVGTGVATASELLLSRTRAARAAESLGHAALMGFLLSLTLPATAPLGAAATGALIAIVIGKLALGGVGRYRWHPALIGRVAVQFIYGASLSFSAGQAQSAVLAPRWLLFGDLGNAQSLAGVDYQGWSETPLPLSKHAIEVERPVQALRRFANGVISPGAAPPIVALVCDELPPWEDTLLGVVPGGIGETCSIVLVIAALYLIYRRALRWELPFGVLSAAFVAAAVLGVRDPVHGGFEWFPGWALWSGVPIGLLYILYHLTSGQLLITTALLAGEPTTSPLTNGGQFVFGLAIGAILIFMRLYGLPETEGYWAILIMNTLVPWLDRRSPTHVPVAAAG